MAPAAERALGAAAAAYSAASLHGQRCSEVAAWLWQIEMTQEQSLPVILTILQVLWDMYLHTAGNPCGACHTINCN